MRPTISKSNKKMTEIESVRIPSVIKGLDLKSICADREYKKVTIKK